MSEPIFPPLTLDTGRAEWTPRDKLARLVSLSREIGMEGGVAQADDLADERLLFWEIVGLLEGRDEALGRERSLHEEADSLAEERDEARNIARLAVGAWRGHQESGHPPGCGYDEAEIQALYADYPWLKNG